MDTPPPRGSGGKGRKTKAFGENPNGVDNAPCGNVHSEKTERKGKTIVFFFFNYDKVLTNSAPPHPMLNIELT